MNISEIKAKYTCDIDLAGISFEKAKSLGLTGKSKKAKAAFAKHESRIVARNKLSDEKIFYLGLISNIESVLTKLNAVSVPSTLNKRILSHYNDILNRLKGLLKESKVAINTTRAMETPEWAKNQYKKDR